MNFFKKILFLIFFFTSTSQVLYADSPYFLDFKLILNESIAGKKAQTFLKNKLENGIKNIQNKQKKIQEEEKMIIQKKKSFQLKNMKKM